MSHNIVADDGPIFLMKNNPPRLAFDGRLSYLLLAFSAVLWLKSATGAAGTLVVWELPGVPALLPGMQGEGIMVCFDKGTTIIATSPRSGFNKNTWRFGTQNLEISMCIVYEVKLMSSLVVNKKPATGRMDRPHPVGLGRQCRGGSASGHALPWGTCRRCLPAAGQESEEPRTWPSGRHGIDLNRLFCNTYCILKEEQQSPKSKKTHRISWNPFMITENSSSAKQVPNLLNM